MIVDNWCVNTVTDVKTCVHLFGIQTSDNRNLSKVRTNMMDIQLSTLTDELRDDLKKADRLIRNNKSVSTKKAYSGDWDAFIEWCEGRGLSHLPASRETVALYVASESERLKWTTLQRRLVAINQAHKWQRLDPPALRTLEPLHSVWSGLMRTRTAKKRKVSPLLIEDILAICDLATDELSDKRDKALILIGFAGALRRSELANLEIKDLSFVPDGLKIIIRKSKTDQEGHGFEKGIAYGQNIKTCPIRALKSWLDVSGINQGRVFRSIDRYGNMLTGGITGHAIATVVKKWCDVIGLDASMYSGHSLRAGFATQAARSGAEERHIMNHTGHKSIKTAREYIRGGGLFENNPTSLLGL